MNTLFRTPSRFIVLGLAAAFSISQAHAQSFKLGHIAPPSHVWHQVSEKFASDLERASGGKMKVAVSPLQKLGNEGQVINLMQAGAVQFAILTTAGLANREESLLAWSLPLVFRDVEHASRATRTPAAKEMLRNLEPSGLVGLGYVFAGMRQVLSVAPVTSSSDLANRKIRSFPSPIHSEWWKLLGAAPTSLPLSEVAPSLTTKLLDAVDIDLDALVGLKFYQQAPNLTLTNHMAFPGVFVASRKWWNARTEVERTMILELAAAAQDWGVQAAIDADLTNLAKAQAGGVHVVAADITTFHAAGARIREQYTVKNRLIADFYAQSKDL